MSTAHIDWNTYTDEDIERFLQEIIEELEQRKTAKRQALKEQITTLLTEHNMSLKEVFGRDRKNHNHPVKYQNPAEPGQTWTGTGRQPAWVKDALANGQTLADLDVSPAPDTTK